MTFGVGTNLPSLTEAIERRKFFYEAKDDEIHKTLLFARDIAHRNNEDAMK
jgi:hypothetical protein